MSILDPHAVNDIHIALERAVSYLASPDNPFEVAKTPISEHGCTQGTFRTRIFGNYLVSICYGCRSVWPAEEGQG
jgi:hypothetical protein